MLQLNAKDFLKNIQHRSGVYQMLNERQEVLYVGKAKDLRQRLASYFRNAGQHPRTLYFLKKVVAITTIVTANEAEALLLEYSLIKSLRPRYNILLKDDKSFPYLFLSSHQYPFLMVCRGTQKESGIYFGPFSDSQSVHETLSLLQKIFKLRKCSDNIFNRRSRPCLQYQIGRCSAPCVGNISVAEYARQVGFVKMFLTGRSRSIVKDMAQLMVVAARQLEFEQAAIYREQLVALKAVQQRQYIIHGSGDIDVVALVVASGYFCIDVLTVRNGLVLGNKNFCDECLDFVDQQEILLTFLMQYYLRPNVTSAPVTVASKAISIAKSIATSAIAGLPHQLLLNVKLTADASSTLTKALKHTKLRILDNKTNNKKYRQWLQLTNANAEHGLQRRLMSNVNFVVGFTELQQALSLSVMPRHVACFDVSHHGGEATVVACVVFAVTGALKGQYRRYNIKAVAANDDYGALREGLQRHFMNVRSADDGSGDNANSDELKLPELLLIDGGKGQLRVAMAVLAELNISDVVILGIAKGDDRKVGTEKIYSAPTQNLVHLPSRAMSLVLRIRDEAHRFAIATQRNTVRRRRVTSILENIPGIGKQKRDLLLQHFGGWQEIRVASVEELCQVRGVNIKLAQGIYDYIASCK